MDSRPRSIVTVFVVLFGLICLHICQQFPFLKTPWSLKTYEAQGSHSAMQITSTIYTLCGYKNTIII